MKSSDIFLGPVLRRAQADLVVICLSTFQPLALKFSVKVSGKDGWIGHDAVPVNFNPLPGLYFYFGKAVPLDGSKFPSNALLEYSIGILDPSGDADYSFFEKIVRDDSLAYKNNPLPTFFLQAPQKKLNALYGSCRKIHDTNGGKVDALSFGDDAIYQNFTDLDNRPAVLCLGGDQIYADDVHKLALEEAISLSKKICGGKDESLPDSLTLPGVGNRKSFVSNYAKFTSGESDNHLVTFGEYLAMYGLMWNVNNWSKPIAELAHFTDTLPKVRRLLANIPTYMIFDDHDVTDDWNLSVKWKGDVSSKKLGKRIVANALAAAWLCQAYGNDPDHYTDALAYQIADVIANKEKDPDTFASNFWGLDKWEFYTPTYPFIYFLDTRTQRSLKDGDKGLDTGAPAFLKSMASWAVTMKMLMGLLKNQNRDWPLILVAPAPVFGFKMVEDLQAAISAVAGPYFLDLESWSANKKHMQFFLHLMGNKDVVLLSGDVHYGFTATVKFSVFDDATIRSEISQFPKDVSPPANPSGAAPGYNFLWSAKFIQLTSSALKNFADNTKVKIPANLTTIEPGVFLNEGGSAVEGKYENGNFYEWVDNPFDDKPGYFVKTTKEALKPACLFRQHINDAINSRYVSEHNIGLLTVSGREVKNCFYTPNGKESERIWNLLNDSYWA